MLWDKHHINQRGITYMHRALSTACIETKLRPIHPVGSSACPWQVCHQLKIVFVPGIFFCRLPDPNSFYSQSAKSAHAANNEKKNTSSNIPNSTSKMLEITFFRHAATRFLEKLCWGLSRTSPTLPYDNLPGTFWNILEHPKPEV